MTSAADTEVKARRSSRKGTRSWPCSSSAKERPGSAANDTVHGACQRPTWRAKAMGGETLLPAELLEGASAPMPASASVG